MLIFKCDRCGKEIARDEAWNISMVPEAYAAEEERRKLHAELKVQGELCRDCAEIILGEMIYLKEVPARDCHGAERIAMTETGVPKRAADSRPYEEKGCAARTEGRYIMIARKRAGMKIDELAEKLYICGATLKTWEKGRKKKLPWDEMETVLPEGKGIREKGCAAFCPSPKMCLGGGKCYYSGKRG